MDGQPLLAIFESGVEADGKVVKIVAQLLPWLPPRPHRIKVIFMERDLDEVCNSQQVMLDNLDKQGARLPQDKLKQTWSGQLAGLKKLLSQQGSLSTHYIEHAEVITNPRRIARQIELFLGCDMDLDAMAAVVDPSLHRQRRSSSGQETSTA